MRIVPPCDLYEYYEQSPNDMYGSYFMITPNDQVKSEAGKKDQFV